MNATMTEQRIEIPYPDEAEPSLLLRLGPCRVSLAGVRIDSGLGAVDITVPSLTAVRVATKTFASARRATGSFIAKGDVLSTAPAMQGARPLLDIDVSLAFGSLTLTTD